MSPWERGYIVFSKQKSFELEFFSLSWTFNCSYVCSRWIGHRVSVVAQRMSVYCLLVSSAFLETKDNFIKFVDSFLLVPEQLSL